MPDARIVAAHASILHLIGPGGAGKTSVGPLLAQRLGMRFIDLDACFLAVAGDITAVIRSDGYAAYVRRNVAVYFETRDGLTAPAVLALSSGFMTYPEDIEPRYPALLRALCADPLTALLLPAFDCEACVEMIVRRQLARPYLPGDRASEERRIRQRFPLFAALPCARFQSDVAPDVLAQQMAQWARMVVPS